MKFVLGFSVERRESAAVGSWSFIFVVCICSANVCDD